MPLTTNFKKGSFHEITDKKKLSFSKESKTRDKEAKGDHSYSLIKNDTPEREKINKSFNDFMAAQNDACYLMESNSETKLRKIQNKIRSGVTRSDTLLDAVAKNYSLHAPIEEKPCGDEGSAIKDKNFEEFSSSNQRKEFRSVSPCLTDPNSIALVNGSPQSSNIAFESLEDNADTGEDMEDPLLAGWDDDDLFLYRSSDMERSYTEDLDMAPVIDGFIANLSCSGGDAENEDKFSSCFDDTDSEVDVVFCGSENGKKEMRSKININSKKTSYSRSKDCETRGQRSISAPGLSSQRPATPWPATQAGEEFLLDRAGEQKGKILKTILVSSVIAILAFFWFPWYE